jgi:hypothetical protein
VKNHWLLNETDPGGGEAPEPEPMPEPPAPAPEGEPPEGYVPRQQFDELQEQFQELEGLRDYMQTLPPEAFAYPSTTSQAGQPQPGYGEPADENLPPDPSVDPYGFQQWLNADRERLAEELSGRFDPVMKEMHDRQAQTQLDQAITGLPEEARHLGLPENQHEQAEEAIEHLTAAFLPIDLGDQVANLPPEYAERVVQQQLGAAAEQASAYLGQLLELARTQAREDYKASLQGGGQGEQPREPAVAGAGIPGNAPAGSYDEIVNRYLGAVE